MMELNENTPAEAVAVVGMAGRFPRARTLDQFWQKLRAGEELVTFFSDEELLADGIPPELLRDPKYVKARAVLEDADLFDAAFFGINPREAELMDPQQRLFLECAWEALEHAGYDADRYRGAAGVFAGLSMNSYLFNNLARNEEVVRSAGGYQVMLASDKDFVATRASYKLNLRGPSLTVQTACSTSLVAVQLACQSLLNYQSDLALAGGVSVSAPRAAGYLYQPGMIMSPDGHCRAFDADGRGIVAGEGVGLVVLKRLSEALADGDTIHAVILGSAINNDGAQKVGYTAPSVDGQAEVIATAQALAGVGPDSISYVEAHGTGTELGDPIEVAALTQAFRAGTDARAYCALGSVKTNMGHLDAAAGVAGLLKTILALVHQEIPPSLHFRSPNPNIDFSHSPFYVNTVLKPWDTPHGGPRRAGVSSFGIGGTNAHVVLEEAPPQAIAPSNRSHQLLVLSARTPYALERATESLAEHLRAHPEQHLADVAYTLQTGRKAFGERRAVVVNGDTSAAADALQRGDRRLVLDGSTDVRDRPVAFLFTGQGSQYVHMTRELYDQEPVFRQELDRCAELLRPHLGLDIREVLYPGPEREASAASALLQTRLAQPALFAVEYALARLWMSWGVTPRAIIGHSIGEYVAACLAGVFSVEDALALVAARGALMQDLPAGSMLAVSLSESELRSQLEHGLSIAAVNAPRLCVVSGPTDHVQALARRLAEDGVGCRTLHTSHAFHSPMMEPMLPSFMERLSEVRMQAPQLDYVSNLTGTWATAEQATNPAYWAAHVRGTVRFADGVAALSARLPEAVLLEIGPGALTSLVKQLPDRSAGHLAVATLRHPQDPTSDEAVLLGALGRLWLAGVNVDWPAVHAEEQRRRVPLPTYPFERQRFWIQPAAPMSTTSALQADAANDAAPARRDDVTSWFYQPSWRRRDLARSAASAPSQHWLVFCDRAGAGDRLSDRLVEHGHQVVRVRQDVTFGKSADGVYHLPAADSNAYQHLLRELRSSEFCPTRIVHLWNADPPSQEEDDELDPAGFERAQERGFLSLLFLAQALGEVSGTSPLRIDVISRGVCDVIGDERLLPARAGVLGPCRVIAQEFPHITCRLVDLPVCTDADASLWAELMSSGNGSMVAYRGAHRWEPEYEPVALETDSAPALREQGVYLITGGLGGIGLELAEEIASRVPARLVLVGRSGLPDPSIWRAWVAEHGEDDAISRRIARIERLQALGAEVLVGQADVCDPAAMRDVVARAREKFGPIHGVIHAAGVAGGGIIPLKTRAMADAVLAPKTRGTLVLQDLLTGEPLDFFVLCSSFTSILGGPGQVDYCAANAFLNAFARWRSRRGQPTLAIDWATWSEVGMAVDTAVPDSLRELRAQSLRHGISSAEGRDAFARLLGCVLPELVVSPQEFGALVRSYDRPMLPATSDAHVEDAPTAPAPAMADLDLHARPHVRSAFMAPRSELEAQIARVWGSLLGLAEVGVDDNFFELGGHSLLATQLIGRLQRLFGVELSLRSLFELQTVSQLAARIQELQDLHTQAPVPAGVGSSRTGDREEIEL